MGNEINTEGLLNELKNLAQHVKALLDGSAEGAQADNIKQLQDNARTAVNHASGLIDQASKQLADKSKQVAANAETYIKENPWKAAGIGAIVTYALNNFLSRFSGRK